MEEESGGFWRGNSAGFYKSAGSAFFLGGPGRAESDVSRVRTPAKLHHVCLRFAREIASGPLYGPLQFISGWLLQSEERGPDDCRRFMGPSWR